MVHKVLFWSGFGLAVRLWQLSLEQRPFFNRTSLWAYPIFAGAGGSFGYWLMGVTSRQNAILTERKNNLLEKRRRRAEREAQSGGAGITASGAPEKAVGTGGTGGADMI